ncbi:MAG: hypothetical protein C0408_07735 [Odoribacter sp.]|nr:hypothetical protein [Odoribacter sp.]
MFCVLIMEFVYLTIKCFDMKKKIIFGVSFILIAFAVTSCDALLKNCEFCKLVTRDSSGAVVTSGTETEYCGTDLVTIKATPPIIVAGNTTKYECR